ncbi:MAG: EAL domain-containing protein [Actinomycetota bacterium]|nr:EAL domain-containing protein [Actinomycetota bacterium]
MCEALTELIDAESSLELVGVAGDAVRAVALACTHRPDVVLVDVRMPAGGGEHVVREVASCVPTARLVTLSAAEDRQAVLQMLGAGAVGYLPKGTPWRDILETIHMAARGKAALAGEVATRLVHELASDGARLEQQQRQREEKVARIHQAMAPSALHMVFQPVYDLRSGQVVGVEALARLDLEPARTPNVWLREAAEVGLRVELELKMIEAALAQRSKLPPGAFLALNLTAPTAACERFQAIIRRASPERLVLELTEHAQVDGYEALDAALRDLRERGARLAVDDAGGGYAGLEHLLRLQPDIIKLNLWLTRNVDRDPRRRALATALVTFASDTGALVAAEGIETREERDAVRTLGFHYGQGFFLGGAGPLPLPDVSSNASSVTVGQPLP